MAAEVSSFLVSSLSLRVQPSVASLDEPDVSPVHSTWHSFYGHWLPTGVGELGESIDGCVTPPGDDAAEHC